MLHICRKAHHNQRRKQQCSACGGEIEEAVRPVLGADVLHPHQRAHDALVRVHHRLTDQLQRAVRAVVAGAAAGIHRQDQRLRRAHGHHGAGGGQRARLCAQGLLAAHVDKKNLTAQVACKLR
ncbi:hypothetical protein D3C71_1449130 [compost metagenome]